MLFTFCNQGDNPTNRKSQSQSPAQWFPPLPLHEFITSEINLFCSNGPHVVS